MSVNLKTLVVASSVVLAAFGGVLSSTIAARGAPIALINSASDLTPLDTSAASLSGAFTMGTGANALVVAVPFRSALGTGSVGVTFAGQTADSSNIQLSGDRAGSAWFLFLNPAITTGNIDVDLTVGGATGARAGYAAFALSNVAGVYDDIGSGLNGSGDTTQNLSYDGLADGYAIQILGGEGPGTAAPGIAGSNIDTAVLNWDCNATRYATLWATGGQIAATQTGYSNDFTAYRAVSQSVVSLQAVPEPATTFGLVAAAGAGAILVRRKAKSSKG